MTSWDNLARVVYRRTYARKDTGVLENWQQTVNRVIEGNIGKYRDTEFLNSNEEERLHYYLENRKAGPAGRGWWFSGSPGQNTIGGAALNNCWYFSCDNWENFVYAQDLLMLGGGVGLSVEQRFVSKLSKIKRDVNIIHKPTKDADYIVPDSREGWCDLTYKVLESFFVTGRSFSFSTVCIRGSGEPIKGFGGTSSGPKALVEFVEKLSIILKSREAKHVRPIDAADIICATGEMVVAGNVRRSAIIILGDPFDKEYLKAKRWDLGQIPTYRSRANFSVVVDDIEDLHPYFWKTYEQGEPFGIVNRKNIQTYGRMGEKKKDAAVGVNPCVPGYTEVLTDAGYLPIETLVGKNVSIWNGFEWSVVKPSITGYNQPLVNVTLSSGQSITCTPYHRFLLATDYKGGTKEQIANDLLPGDKLVKVNYPVLDGGKDVTYAYTQGFISAEGMDDYSYFWVYNTKYGCIPAMHLKKVSEESCGNRKTVTPSFDKHPKSFVPFNWSVRSRLAWFSGLLDGDGTVLNEGGSQLCSVDLNFLLQVQKLLTTLGVSCKVVKGNSEGNRFMPDGKGGSKEYYCQTSFRLCISSEAMQHLLGLGLQCVRLDFYGFKPNRDASRFVTVIDVTEAGSADVVYCVNEPKRHLVCFEGVVTMNCAEATLENAEPCNLVELALPNLDNEDEFNEASRLMFRWAKRVTCEKYHIPVCDEVIKRNRRVGVGITGCLRSSLFQPVVLDRAYQTIQDTDRNYSTQLRIPESIRTTVVKPSGTISKVFSMGGYEGIHPAYSRYIIQRVRFGGNDPLLMALKNCGHHMEPEIKFDGSLDWGTQVVDFYERAPNGVPVADEDWDTWKQLDVLKLAQQHWSDQAVSVTVYYKKEDISKLKDWLADNLKYLKSISFLCHSDHGFKQAPKESITEEQYLKLSSKIKQIEEDLIGEGELDSQECAGGMCPVK